MSAISGPAVLFLICVGFFWKLVLTDQYTWLENPDIAYQVLPWYQFQAGEWHKGNVPLWDPYLWAGQPLIGQAQPGAAYPLNWVLFAAPLRQGWIRQSALHWYFVIIHFMAAVFCYWLCRDLGRSKGASIAAGVVFALGGYIGTTDWPQMINGAVWAPLVFLFLLRAVRRRRPWTSAALSGLCLGMAWLSGHHQIPIYTTLAAGGTWLFYILRTGRPDWGIVKLAAVSGVILFAVGAMQTLPAYEYGKLAFRWVGLDEPVGWKDRVPYHIHSQFGFNPLSIIGLALPGVHRNANGFIGVAALALGILALATWWHDARVRLFGILGMAGLFFALADHDILHGLLYAVVPLVDKARSPSMAIFIFNFGFSVLIAYGIDSLSSVASVWPKRIGLFAAGFGVFLYCVITALVVARNFNGDERYLVTALVAILFGAILYGWHGGKMGYSTALPLVVLLMLVELGNVVGFHYHNRAAKNRNEYLKFHSQNQDIVGFLKSRPNPVRISVDDKELQFNFGDWHGIEQFGGYLASLSANLVRHDIHSEKGQNLFGVTHYVGRVPLRPNQLEVFQGSSGMKVFENSGAFPRVWVVHRAARIDGRDKIHEPMNSAEFDLTKATFLLEDPPALEDCAAGDEVRMVHHGAGSVKLLAKLGCKGMVVLSDTWFPGWVATVDGKPARIYEAYGVMRGVVVEGGNHQIEMRYRPRSVILGALLTAFGLLAVLLIHGWERRRPGANRDQTDPSV